MLQRQRVSKQWLQLHKVEFQQFQQSLLITRLSCAHPALAPPAPHLSPQALWLLSALFGCGLWLADGNASCMI